MAQDIEINDTLTIPAAEVSFATSRSSGPGGQHVNKTESRITLLFDVRESAVLSDDQKRRIEARLPTRINRDGILQLHVQLHRSQAANRAEARERFATLLRDALKQRRRRKKTRTPRASKERRLQQKRRRSELKRSRSRAGGDD